ncbi:small heat shock protein p36-like [Babylonia areolata]|uniref:small heat shock protein p36-like n=1 Tax=Babylonia areolata TaxID=304850 RepID=UPI003FD5F2F7
MAVYRSEVHIPVQKDSLNFQDRELKQWNNPQQQQWQDQFDKMRQDFFVLKPSEKQVPAPPTSSPHFPNMDSAVKAAFDVDSQGRQIFRVRFDVSEFKPEEVSVKVQDNKLIVNARHQEKTAQSSVSREYSRQVDIPGGVDQDTLNCLLSKDGILTVEGPVMQPQLLARETFLPVQSTPLTPSSPSAAPRPPPHFTTMGTPVKNPIVTEADGSRRMRLSVDIGEFSPEEIVVKTMDRKLIVHAEHEERTAGRTLHKEFNKEYDLPESVDSSSISAYLTEDRQLTIEAPLKPAPAPPPVQRKMYEVQSQDVQRVVVNKEGSVTIADNRNRPVITISVHRK